MSRFNRFTRFIGFTWCQFAVRAVARAGNRSMFALITLSASALLALCGCAKIPDGTVGPAEYGMLEVRLRVSDQNLGKSAASAGANGSAKTAAETVVVEVGGADLAPTRFKIKIDQTRPSMIDTVKNVPVGKNRRISLWAINKDGDTTHIDSVEYRFADVEIGAAARVSATLIPAAGSIYLQLYGLDGSVSGVHASFTSLDEKRVFENYADRAPRTFLHIDNIPHGMEGTLRVSIIGGQMDTIKTATQKFTFNARADSVVTLQFIDNSGTLGVDVSLLPPGVTAGSYNFNNSVSDVEETGGIIITEIMYSAGDNNYIELYNQQNKETFLDTLTVDVEGKMFQFMNVSIAPNGYLVIGRQSASYTKYVATGLSIVSTGVWITVRRGKAGAIFDRVICAGTNSAIGWPAGVTSSSKRSAELNRDKYDATENNYGKNWTAAAQPIEGTGMFGTPGR